MVAGTMVQNLCWQKRVWIHKVRRKEHTLSSSLDTSSPGKPLAPLETEESRLNLHCSRAYNPAALRGDYYPYNIARYFGHDEKRLRGAGARGSSSQAVCSSCVVTNVRNKVRGVLCAWDTSPLLSSLCVYRCRVNVT